MNIITIIPAPTPKTAIFYDIVKEECVMQKADVIALIEVSNPDDPDDIATVPMYMCCDAFGVYYAPQLDISFFEFMEEGALIDTERFKVHMDHVKKIRDDIQNGLETIEVEHKGNVSHIRRIIKEKKDTPKIDN